MTGLSVREAAGSDREAFLSMWEDFTALAPDEPGDRDMGAVNWSRTLDVACGLRCIVAVDEDDRPVGFTLFLAFPFTWSHGDVCYLQDIYVAADSRGRGAARAMIAHLRELGEAAGWFKIFWMTQADNHTAQRLYDRVATRMDYLRYDLGIATG
jgi:ribosomal protein S18 acetylase RimI-like enzyme